MGLAMSPWVPPLTAALTVAPPQVSRNGMHVTTSYVIAPGLRADAVTGLADLVQFLCTAAEESADPTSWRSGGVVGRATWERIVREDPVGECREMKALIGEAIAWWHETQSAEVVYAQRPHSGTSQPFVDSVSILRCGGGHVVRGIQAKVTADLPRGRINEAFNKFKKLQRGDRDEFWAEAMRRLRIETDAIDGLAVDFAAVSSGTQITHVQAFVCHGRVPPSDPAHDYHPRINAHAYHGRSVALLYDDDIEGLSCAVAAVVRGRVLT
jgi:hypothetical protein